MSSGLIDKSARKQKLLTPNAVAAAVLVAVFSVAFYGLMHYIHVEGVYHPILLMFLPATAIAWFVSILPLLMFIAYQDDFKNLSPLNPLHYFYISKRCFKSMKANDFKVNEKNL